MAAGPRVLLFGDSDVRAAQIRQRLQARGLSATCVALSEPTPLVRPNAGQVAVFLFGQQTDLGEQRRLRQVMEELRARNVATFVWGPTDNVGSSGDAPVEHLGSETSLEEVVGRLTTMAHYVPLIKTMDAELRHLQRLSQQLNRFFAQLDREMQLAGRLQRDFMPQRPPAVPTLSFAHIFRPATFVSGDIFDVIQIDSEHIGLFLADAMGHGTAAGLMTMFLRKALTPSESEADRVRVVAPTQALLGVHNGLARQRLPSSQFITAVYALIHLPTLTMRIARGGHPYPLHISEDGTIAELRPEGGLMGLSDLTPEFDEQTVQLRPRDKILLYTDGIEDLLVVSRDQASGVAEFTPQLLEWAKLDAEALTSAITGHLDHQEGSLNPEDDVTVVVAQVRG